MNSKKWLLMFVLALSFVLAACAGFTNDSSDEDSSDSKDNEQANTDKNTSGDEKVLKLSLDNDIPD